MRGNVDLDGRRERRRLAPRLELLEDRLVLSTWTVTSAADSGSGSLRATIAEAGNALNLGTGGFAPFFAQSLIDLTGSKLAPSYYMIATALLSLAALLALRRKYRV